MAKHFLDTNRKLSTVHSVPGENLLQKNEREIKTSPNKLKLRKCIASKITLKECLKKLSIQ